jgi:YtkA-like protein
MERWLRLEGMLGATVLLCVALLGALAGSLTAPTSSNTSSQPSGPVSQTKTVNGYTITLKVTPATFGTNTFIVIVKNAQGQPETGAAVSINTTMLDMDMGTETTQLQADPTQAGVYSQQADLTMAGHWEVGVRVLPANSNTFVKATFDFSAS